MSNVAIRIEGLGKEYHLGRTEVPYWTIREALVESIRKPLGWLTQGQARVTGGDRFWALQDLSLEIPYGEVLGVIGRNGAGKSTLLKVLSRITAPTTGRVEIHGRVASLLEVGTGFHPELTGRENIFLNGAVLGMSRAEVQRKFDEIVDFADIAGFLDTPVKHYSSGMYMRLAFAVAAHQQQEILLVDEVLAVGDAEFQRKCLGKITEVARAGRTVLFVSHSMRAIQQLCTEVLLLENGRGIAKGRPQNMVQQYLHGHAGPQALADRDVRDLPRQSPSVTGMLKELAHIERVALLNSHGTATMSIGWKEPFEIRLSVINGPERILLNAAVCIKDARGECVFVSHTLDRRLHVEADVSAQVDLTCRVDPNLLMPGEYLVDIWVGSMSFRPFDFLRNILTFAIPFEGTDLSEGDQRPGSIYLPLTWEVNIAGPPIQS